MGATPEMIAPGVSYTRIMLGGNATVLLLFLINAIFTRGWGRNDGDAGPVVG